MEEEAQKRVELLIKKRVDTILESRKQEIESEIKQRVSRSLIIKILIDTKKYTVEIP